MPDQKTYLQMTAAEKRQAVLDLLHQRGGLVFSQIKNALGATTSLTSVLNTMYMRDEIEQAGRISGNLVVWVPLVQQTTDVQRGPNSKARTQEPEKPSTPYGRIVRLLDKPARRSGGQGALYSPPGIQSGMQRTIEAA